MSKEAIIDKILSDAQLKASSIVGEAQRRADEIIADAAEQCKEYIYNSKAETDRLVFDVEARTKTVAELDARKLRLSAKAEILDKIYARTLDKLKNLDDEKYLALLKGMLKSANDGDVVTVSDREKALLTQELLDDFAKQSGKKLKLAPTTGNFDGGLILSENGIDKNFTFEVEVELLREQTETEIAKEIFG